MTVPLRRAPSVPPARASSRADENQSDITYAGVAMHRSGRGAPLVLLHALGCDSRSWQVIAPALAREFTVFAVDLPGFGASPPLAEPAEPSPAGLAEAVAIALDQAGVRDAHVVGNSIGGWVALELAKIRPVATLTLLAPAGMWARNTPWYCWVSLRLTRW